MRRAFVLFGLVIGLFLSTNCAYSFDKEKMQLISDIAQLVNSKEYTKALDKCNEALEFHPNNSELYYWRATINSYLGNKEDALVDMDKSVGLNSSSSDMYVMRGILKSNLDDNEGALEDFQKAIDLDPKNSSAYSMRACVKIINGEYRSANEDLEKANTLIDEVQKENEQAEESESVESVEKEGSK